MQRVGVPFARNRPEGTAVNFMLDCVDSRLLGGKMRKDERKTSEPKGVYRVRNWQEYNAGLIGRGNVTMWIDERVLTNPDAFAAQARSAARLCRRRRPAAARAQAGFPPAAAGASGFRTKSARPRLLRFACAQLRMSTMLAYCLICSTSWAMASWT